MKIFIWAALSELLDQHDMAWPPRQPILRQAHSGACEICLRKKSLADSAMKMTDTAKVDEGEKRSKQLEAIPFIGRWLTTCTRAALWS
jgi:hypothetical protein